MIRQGLLYIPFIIILPKIMGAKGVYFSQPLADVLTIVVCLFSISKMKKVAHDRINTTTD